MKKILRIASLFLLASLLLSLVACPAPDGGDDGDDGKIYHTVYFCHDDDRDGIYDTPNETHRVESGKPAPIYSADPHGYAYRQGPWCYVEEDGTLGEAYTENSPITEDTRLMVKWEKNNYDVTYLLGGPYVSIKLNYGEKIPHETVENLREKLPASYREDVDAWLARETADGKVFLYWSYEGAAWDFENDTVFGHITLTPVFGMPLD